MLALTNLKHHGYNTKKEYEQNSLKIKHKKVYEQDHSNYLTSSISTRNINHSHYQDGSTLARPLYSKLLTLDTIEHRDRISLLLDIQLKTKILILTWANITHDLLCPS